MGDIPKKTITDRAYVSPVSVGNCGDEEFLSTASTELTAPYINALWVKKKDVNRKPNPFLKKSLYAVHRCRGRFPVPSVKRRFTKSHLEISFKGRF